MELIICTSPLQVLIAERIIQENSDKSFIGVYLTYILNDKSKYYYNRLRSACHQASIIVVPWGLSRMKKIWHSLMMIVRGYTFPKINTIYLASLDITEMQLMLHRLRGVPIHTFDDGLLNLSPVAWEHIQRSHMGSWYRILKFIFQFRSAQELLASSLRHYTIYKLSNMVHNNAYHIAIHMGVIG